MLTLLILGAFIALIIRRLYYYPKDTSLGGLLVYSIKYLFFQRIHTGDSDKIKRNKMFGNTALIAFYFLFLAAMLYPFLFPDQA